MSVTAEVPSSQSNDSQRATEAYRHASGGRINEASDWQTTIFSRLSNPDADAGYLLLTPTGAGKIEAILIPSLGLHRGGRTRRVFIISADGSPLDDYVVRVSDYLKAWSTTDLIPRTLYIDSLEQGKDGNAVRFDADGNVVDEIAMSPLEADVDVVLTTFSRFQDLFFGGGGVHGLPSALPSPEDTGVRRDLFFFDEAQSYSTDDFSQFLRLVEFLFAEDIDIVVGSSTMSPGFEEELSFLEKVVVPSRPLPVTIAYKADDDSLAAIAREAQERYASNRVAIVVETALDAETVIDSLPAAISGSVTRYVTGIDSDTRRESYARLVSSKQPALIVSTGKLFEASDLSVDVVLTTTCLPESLILRAGRCHRRADGANGDLIVIGSVVAGSRKLNNAQYASYLHALGECSGTQFDPSDWKKFI